MTTDDSAALVQDWLAVIEARYDAGSQRHLRDRGVGTGWRCWEVGAGSGSIALWLADQVGPSGSVLATDLDLRFLASLAHANLVVRRHNICDDPAPPGGFDLIHARLLLEHLPQRDRALDTLVAALAPGGWLLVEENDNASIAPATASPEAAALHAKVRAATVAAIAARTGRLDTGTYGRRLPEELRRRGLSEIDAEGRVYLSRGGSGLVSLQLLYEQLAQSLVATGSLTAAELGRYRELLADPDFALLGEVMLAAWGRRRLTSAGVDSGNADQTRADPRS